MNLEAALDAIADAAWRHNRKQVEAEIRAVKESGQQIVETYPFAERVIAEVGRQNTLALQDALAEVDRLRGALREMYEWRYISREAKSQEDLDAQRDAMYERAADALTFKIRCQTCGVVYGRVVDGGTTELGWCACPVSSPDKTTDTQLGKPR